MDKINAWCALRIHHGVACEWHGCPSYRGLPDAV